ncbi:MAG: hypothetical protein QOD10_3830 [Mycobacterium sp.]|jgi:hypothetical protein|nr:hypothetical protein [Mycobacterium sp.]
MMSVAIGALAGNTRAGYGNHAWARVALSVI